MGQLIMWNLITLDGFFEGPTPWSLEWHSTVWGPELERLSTEQLHGAERLLFGRRTYEGMAAYWQSEKGAAEGEAGVLMNSLPKVVVSHTLERATWNNSTLISSDAIGRIARLKREGQRPTYVFGSAELSASLLEHGLFDELRILVAPTVIGAGKPLFGRGKPGPKLELLDAQVFASGGVRLRYRPTAIA